MDRAVGQWHHHGPGSLAILLVTKFTGSGKEFVLAAEREFVHTAMSRIAEQNITTVDAHTTGAGHNTWYPRLLLSRSNDPNNQYSPTPTKAAEKN